MPIQRNPVLEAITNPTKNFLATFLVGTILFNLISDGLSVLFWENFNPWLQAQLGIANKTELRGYVLIVLILVVLVLIYGTNLTKLVRSQLVRWSLFGTQIPDQASVMPSPKSRCGLVVLMSPRPNSPAEAAIRYHWQSAQSPLQHCWIICTDSSVDQARLMKQRLLAEGLDEHHLQLYYGSYKLDDPDQPGLTLTVSDRDADNPETILELVNAIYADAATQDLDESDLLVDFTGGTKPMSVGAVLACTSPSRSLQYLTQTNPPKVVEVKVSYKIKPV